MVIPQSEYARGAPLFLIMIISRELSTWYGEDAVGEMKRLPSLLRSAAIAAALSVAVISAAPLVVFDDAYASGRDDDRDDDHDWDDNSGHGNSDDWDNIDDIDNSGPGSGDDWNDVDDNSGHGSGDDETSDNSGPGSGDDDPSDNSGSSSNDDHSNSGPGGGGGSSEATDNHGGNSGPGGSSDHDYDVIDFVAENAIYSVEYDSHGDEYVPGEIVFVGTASDLATALNLGFREISLQHLRTGGVIARLGLPTSTSVDQSRAMLAQATPDAIVTLNNIYRSAQAYRAASSQPPPARSRARLRGTLGVIDTGVDASAVSGALLSQNAFAGPNTVARSHGSTVVAIAVSRGVHVQVADVFGHSPDGALAASADRIAAAIDWMIEHRIAVINISVEGPANPVLQEMVRRAAERGHIIVAAAGNGGPAARPIFPAAFDGVLAVTAIDDEGRPYIRANRGDYIDFAANGVNVIVEVGGSSERVSGTSFAAPVIAANAAIQLHAPSPTEAARVVARMRAHAEDLGAPGRDDIFGWGALR